MNIKNIDECIKNKCEHFNAEIGCKALKELHDREGCIYGAYTPCESLGFNYKAEEEISMEHDNFIKEMMGRARKHNISKESLLEHTREIVGDNNIKSLEEAIPFIFTNWEKKLMEKGNGEIIHMNPNSTGYVDSMEYDNANITKEEIITKVKDIIELSKLLNQRNEPKDILEGVCLKNNLKLSTTDKKDILRAIEIEYNK